MNKIEKRSDLYREYARVIDMCEGTNVNPLKCIKLGESICNLQEIYFTDKPSVYSFAIAIIEDKPVFVGDELYDKDTGIKVVIENNTIHNDKLLVSGVATFYININLLSWNPPKPKTFNLNGVELPLPDAKIVRSCSGINIVDSHNNNIGQCYSITFCGIEYNWSKQEYRDSVSKAITKLLQGK